MTLLNKAYHAWVTDNYGRGCKTNGLPWVINCDFNLAQDMMSHFYPNLKNGTKYDPNRIFTFNQTEILGLGKRGYAYIPKNCETKTCDVHFVLHGCEMSEDIIGTIFVE